MEVYSLDRSHMAKAMPLTLRRSLSVNLAELWRVTATGGHKKVTVLIAAIWQKLFR